MTRRDLLLGFSALGALPRLRAQTGPPIPIRALSHMTLTVTDPARSIEFYQALFGMPVQARQGPTTLLRIGAGPQFLALNGGPNAKPGINHFCLTTDNFSVDRMMKTLGEHGVSPAEAGGRGGTLSGGALKARVRIRGENLGGAKEGTAELYVGDPDGLVVQLQDTTYCGGGGKLGEICAAPEPSPHKGLIAVRDLSHFTLFVSDAERSRAFYQGLFGMPIQVHQGPATPLLAVGANKQFLTIVGTGTPAINHVCLTIEHFDPDKVMKTLADCGLKPRENARGPVGPMTSYISMRRENRGGAKEGTPELYFTDPDGILLQLQDVTYCGGAGRMGEVC